MFKRSYSVATGFADAPNRDAIDGFAAIAAALDQGLADPPRPYRGKIVDAIAIALAWLVLIAVILYPALQLAAIAVCVGFIVCRALLRVLARAIWPAYPVQLLPVHPGRSA